MGTTWHAKFDYSGARADADHALDWYRQAMRSAMATAFDRVTAANLYATLAAKLGCWDQAAHGWDITLDALPMLAQHRLTRADRQHRLVPIQGLSSHAAATALARGDTARAWEVLEQGRAVLLTQELDMITMRAALCRSHHDLADELDRLRTLLGSEPAEQDSPTETDRAALARVAAAQEWRKLTAKIRELPEFERFGLPLTVAELCEAAGGDTIVTLSTVGDRGDALIIAAGEVSSLPLPGLTRRAATRAVNVLISATQLSNPKAEVDTYPVPENWLRGGDSADPGADPDDDRRQRSWRLHAVLTWLWRTAAEPVLAHLGYPAKPADDRRTWPRVVWLPTGPFTLLPIHAAGDYLGGGVSVGDNVLDRVVSSYTSTMRTLRYARERRANHRTRVGLAVGVPKAPGAEPLHAAGEEAATVAAPLGGTALVDEDATKTAVLTHLKDAEWAHFACHGLADAAVPVHSRLILQDGALKVSDLLHADAAHAQLGYLSACMTAFSGARLFDESTHMASVLQLASFSHVVGTLWPIPDRPAVKIAKSFYAKLADDFDPALVLHHAIRGERDWYGPDICAAYVHYGPASPD